MLTGPEQLEWVNAFFRAFSNREFTDLMLYRLDDRIDQYAADTDPAKTAIGKRNKRVLASRLGGSPDCEGHRIAPEQRGAPPARKSTESRGRSR